MKQFNVTGMNCAACSARMEKAVSQVPGVTACSVALPVAWRIHTVEVNMISTSNTTHTTGERPRRRAPSLRNRRGKYNRKT